MDGTSPETERKVLSPPEKLVVYTRNALTLYEALLRSGSDEATLVDLGVESREELDTHLADLSALKTILGKVKRGERFIQVVEQPDKQLDRPHQLRRSFAARFILEGEPLVLPEDPNNPQLQLCFNVNIAGYDPDTLKETYYALGLRQQFDMDKKTALVETAEQIVNINTVRVYRDTSSRKVVVMPRGGISFRMKKDENRAKVMGFLHVGLVPHYTTLSRTIPSEDFREMQSYIMETSGFKPQPPALSGK